MALTTMPADVAELLRRHGGILTCADAEAAGVSHGRLQRLVAARLLIRPVRGAFVDASVHAQADAWTRHAITARAVAMTSRFAFLTGWSALAHFALPTVGRPPQRPQLVDPRGLVGRNTRDVSADQRRAHVPARHLLASRSGVRVVTPAFAMVDAARSATVPHALVTADDVARRHAAADPASRHRFDLDDAWAAIDGWPGSRRAAFVVGHADPAAETPLESLGRFAFVAADLPPSVSNAWIRMPDGRWYRVDHLWPHHGVIAEGNGALKYDVLDRAAARMNDEREREWLLRQHEGLDVLHYGWDIAYYRPKELAARARRMLDARPIRPTPVRWWKRAGDGRYVEATDDDQPSPQPPGVILPGAWDRPLR